MASIQQHINVSTDPATVWDAMRDFANVDERVARGFVVESHPDGDARIVTFANGAVAREQLVDIDDVNRRLVYTVVDGPLGAKHHQASVEVREDPADPSRTHVVWVTDVLPHDLAPMIDGLMQQGAVAIERTFAG
jgi:hypothetical protein